MDICVRKPLVATCGLDKTIKIWNYEEKTIELNWQFNEEIFALSFHPSGFYLVVAFTDRLKLMAVTLHNQANMNKQRYYKEIAPFKGCKEIRFSNGGQYFAAVNGGSSNHLIQVFRFWTGEAPVRKSRLLTHPCRVTPSRVTPVESRT